MGNKQKRKDKPRAVSVRGIVEMLGNGTGPFDAVLVADNDEEFYIHVPSGKPDPTEYADQYVEISGIVQERDGYLTISAKNISVVDSMSEYNNFDHKDEWYEQEYEDYDFDDYFGSSRRSGGGEFYGD